MNQRKFKYKIVTGAYVLEVVEKSEELEGWELVSIILERGFYRAILKKRVR